MLTNKELVIYLIEWSVLRTSEIINAFWYVDRADFVGTSFGKETYKDSPLRIGFEQTISQPTTVGMMLEFLQPKKWDKILDVWSWSWWTTALLAYIVWPTWSVIWLERIPELLQFWSNNLKKYKFWHAKIKKSWKKLGIPSQSFNKILVSAAAKYIPDELVKQLKEDWKMVIPVTDSIFEVRKQPNHEIKKTKHRWFSFVKLIH